jgi:TPR repeat protein
VESFDTVKASNNPLPAASVAKKPETQPAIGMRLLPKRQPAQVSAQASDPEKLWAKVKRGDRRAELALAQAYLEGTSVARNCEQAQVLLEDAYRKGDSHAGELLSANANQCR